MEKSVYSKQDFVGSVLNKSNQELSAIDHSGYIPVKLKQSNGKVRLIYRLPDNNILANIQEKLNQNFFNTFYFSNAAHGFVKGKSYRTFLEPHKADPYEQKDKLFLKLDIKDFFPSITKDLIKGSLAEYIKIEDTGQKEEVLNWTVNAITLGGKLPMGARTSPVISNLVFRRIDARIQKYCFDTNITYTRYADDLLFSSYQDICHNERFINLIIGILREYNMELNFNKIRRGVGTFSTNGFVISDTLRLSRKKLEEIRRVLFVLDVLLNNRITQKTLLEQINEELIKNSSTKRFYSLSHINNFLAGQRAFLIAWIPNQNSKFQTQSKKLIKRIDSHLEGLSEYNELNL
ncbi:reverse transcriptase family protein [Sporosarcina luteola]|uniref:reverse transcriptase family protein n=1 Tax=Sporosarcina luteola TaxID=582850 RepID=UPI00203BB642|nr:reverse transcriptase family protein [Sporosarcina luteola]MCM3711685.1 reverse transcriptase family protein [Sporosarcina luteola]